MRSSCLLLILFVFLWGCKQKSTALFEQLSLQQTGVNFNNTITDNDSFNILTYEYIYNGGGVAIADFNQDGQQDLFFTGNQVENKLYLNKGDWKFEDITAQAGVAGKDRWKSSVAITDLNYDGKMDIYVTCMTLNPAPRRANLLYINQGNDKNGVPVFKELAKAYGIADTAHTTSCAFLDFDNDGDQDLYLAVNFQRKYKNESPNSFRPKDPNYVAHTHDHLYRNDWDPVRKHAVFTDVSLEAGIKGEGFGLAINISDINQDGWKDIYVSNDYLTNDHLYINNQDGTFTDRAAEYIKHTSYSAMGNDVVDFNNDGLLDIVAVDMLPEDNYRRKTMLPANNYNTFQNFDEFKYQHQYVRNTLQINQGIAPGTGHPVFSEISMFAGVSSTDWSWTPLAADFDQDGYRDLIITNGFPKDVTDLDFGDYNSNSYAYASKGLLNENIPSVKLKNYAFRNRGDLTFESMGEKWGVTQNSFSNGAAYGDLDNDGDLDYVVNNINDPASIFRNNAVRPAGRPRRERPYVGAPHSDVSAANWLSIKLHGDSLNPMGLGTWIEIQYGKGQKQVWEHSIYRGYLSCMQPLVHFGLGKNKVVDQITITWPNKKRQVLSKVKANQVLDIDYRKAKAEAAPPSAPAVQSWFNQINTEAGVNYVQQEVDFIDFNLQPLLPHKLSQYGPGIAVADVNGDQLDDFFVSGSHFNKGRFFIQKADGRFQQQDLIQGPEGPEKQGEDLGVLFFDADGDGDEDLYTVRGGVEYSAAHPAYQDVLYLNNAGKFSSAQGALPDFIKSGTCVRAADFDRDGDLDLFIGGRVRQKEYPKPVSSYLLKNESANGKVKFVLANEQLAPQLNDLGLVCDALWTDYDQDGWVDLLLAGEWMPLTLFKNKRGKLENATKGSGLEAYTGWWGSLLGADFDGDGDIDYLAGNLGQNTLFKASAKFPLSVYAADFDGNQGYDAIPSAFFPNEKGIMEEFPYHNRLDMDKQLILSKREYLLHAEFAKINMSKYLENFPNVKPLHLSATHIQSSFIRNLGNGKFAIEALPSSAQMAPLYGMLAGDWNGDGHWDALCVGNDYGSEVTTGRYDALNGLLLIGNGKGGFKTSTLAESGFYVPGDAKSLVQLSNAKGEQYIVAGQNRGPLQLFKPRNYKSTWFAYSQSDAKAEVKLGSGKILHYELYQSTGFLSQSARKIWIPQNAVEVTLIDFKGNKDVIKI